MKLAEALLLRADLQRKIAHLHARLKENALVQEGSKPAENPTSLVELLEKLSDELEVLIKQINKTNTAASISDGRTLTDALARRDVLKLKQAAYRDLASAATPKQSTYTRSEIRFVSAVDVEAIQSRADSHGKEFRELDGLIQEANWRTELMA